MPWRADIMEFITNMNWTEIAVIVGIIIALADRIARLTPTKSDDAVLKIVYRLAAMLSVKVPDIETDKKE
jgi:hypothetical protein